MSDIDLHKQLVQLLSAGQAHITFDDAVADFPKEMCGVRPSGSPHSAWELLEHLRIALEDIARFSRATRGDYLPLKWPDDYWPASSAPPDPEEWDNSVEAVRETLATFTQAVEDPKRNLFEPFPWGDGQTLLREALLVADHNAYHLGQLMLIRRILEQAGKTR